MEMVHLSEELAYRSTVKWSLCVCWIDTTYATVKAVIELLLAWFWCAVGVIYQMREEL